MHPCVVVVVVKESPRGRAPIRGSSGDQRREKKTRTRMRKSGKNRSGVRKRAVREGTVRKVAGGGERERERVKGWPSRRMAEGDGGRKIKG